MISAARLGLCACLALLVAGCGGSSTQKTAKELSQPIDCGKLGQTTLRATECVPGPRVRSISGRDVHPIHRVVPHVHCKVRLDATFYAANDWLSLAAALARHVSPCADYYISIPPVRGREGTWTVPNPKEAEIIRRFGPQFHAMAEIRVWAWANWVQRHKRSWYDAGVLARKRMVTAGYAFSLGDIWAVNEFPVTLPTSRGQESAMADFVRGLYQGGPHEPSRQGLVWRVVPFQDETDLDARRTEVKSWLGRDSFWRDMSRYVRWWSSEVFAFPSASCAGTLGQRAANVQHYLHSLPLLAEAGKSEDATARAFLRRAYTPLGNAAWQWTYGFGVTTIPSEQMAKFVALQVYSTTSFAKSRPKLQRPVRVGFAWAPKNTEKLSPKRFAQGNARILERLATALHDAVTPGGVHPGRACGRDGLGCLCSYPGARLKAGWLSFPRWKG